MTASTDYSDDQIVYVDMNAKEIVGPVEWKKEGIYEKKEKKDAPNDADTEERRFRKRKKQYYPSMTYRTAKILLKIDRSSEDDAEGKQFDVALQELFEDRL